MRMTGNEAQLKQLSAASKNTCTGDNGNVADEGDQDERVQPQVLNQLLDHGQGARGQGR